MFEIKPIKAEDHSSWLELWQGYLTFYQANLDQKITEETFNRIISGEINGAVAKDESGQLIGLVHWLTQRSTWSIEEICYLEDLFVAESQRGKGFGSALIEHVQNWAKENGVSKIYWLTAETNLTARSLYDKIAKRTGFIHYEIKGE